MSKAGIILNKLSESRADKNSFEIEVYYTSPDKNELRDLEYEFERAGKVNKLKYEESYDRNGELWILSATITHSGSEKSAERAADDIEDVANGLNVNGDAEVR